MTDTDYNIGILAYGSLIDNPGPEISAVEVSRIDCITPFKVEFARSSGARSGAPTLIPVKEGGQQVGGTIICLASNTTPKEAINMLWRREIHTIDSKRQYSHTHNPTSNTVVVEMEENLMGVRTVYYTCIGRNITETLTGELLADLAIQSILAKAGQQKKDGIRYLLDAKRNGIVTPLSGIYEEQVLLKEQVVSLEAAIDKLDRQRLKGRR